MYKVCWSSFVSGFPFQSSNKISYCRQFYVGTRNSGTVGVTNSTPYFGIIIKMSGFAAIDTAVIFSKYMNAGGFCSDWFWSIVSNLKLLLEVCVDVAFCPVWKLQRVFNSSSERTLLSLSCVLRNGGFCFSIRRWEFSWQRGEFLFV